MSHPPILVAFDLVGIFVFALTGGLVGVRKGLDIFGVLVLAGTTGLGGGFLRDVLIGAVPPAALADWRWLESEEEVADWLDALALTRASTTRHRGA